MFMALQIVRTSSVCISMKCNQFGRLEIIYDYYTKSTIILMIAFTPSTFALE